MACSHTSNCALYPQISLSSALKVWQVFYCEGDYSKCVRYQTSAEGKQVPDTLLPNGKNLEIQISTGKANANDMVSAMKAEAEKDSTDKSLSELQGAINVMDKQAEAPASNALVPDEAPDSSKTLTNPAINPDAVSGPTSSYYLRMRAQDKTGVMSNIIQVLGKHNISVDAMAQKKFSSDQKDTVMMIVTGQAKPDAIQPATEEIAGLGDINGKVISIPLEFLDGEMFA